MIDTALVREAWLTAHPGKGWEFDTWLNNVMLASYNEGYRGCDESVWRAPGGDDE